MEQKLEKSGQNLNPMFYWKWVMKNKVPKAVPLVVLSSVSQTDAEVLSLNFNRIDYVFFDVPPNESMFVHENIKFAERARYTEKEYLDLLSRADYFYSPKEKDRIEAGLCGCKILHSVSELINFAEDNNIKILGFVERITNWENTKNLLT